MIQTTTIEAAQATFNVWVVAETLTQAISQPSKPQLVLQDIQWGCHEILQHIPSEIGRRHIPRPLNLQETFGDADLDDFCASAQKWIATLKTIPLFPLLSENELHRLIDEAKFWEHGAEYMDTLIKNGEYHPQPADNAEAHKKTIIAVVGRTAAGKDTLTKLVSDKMNIPILVSYTDRPIRETENQGVEHIFLSKEGMDNLLAGSEPLAYTEIRGHRYCTMPEQILNQEAPAVFYIVDPKGVDFLKERFTDQFHLETVYVIAPPAVRQARYERRGTGGVPFADRDKDENAQFIDFENNLDENHTIVISNTGHIAANAALMTKLLQGKLEKIALEEQEAASGYEEAQNEEEKDDRC